MDIVTVKSQRNDDNDYQYRTIVDLTVFELLHEVGAPTIKTINMIRRAIEDRVKTLEYKDYWILYFNKQSDNNKNSALFLNKLKNNLTKEKIYGMQKIYKESIIFREVARELMTKRKLFGDLLEESIESALTLYSNNFNSRDWDGTGTPLQMVYPFCRKLMDIKNKNNIGLKGNILTNDEGDLFETSTLELENKLKRERVLNNNYESSEYYVDTMSKMYTASAILFSDRSYGRSNLRELYYSIANKLKTEELYQLSIEMESLFPKLNSVFSLQKYVDRPHKKRTPSAEDYIDVWDGHLPYKLSGIGYNSIPIGHETTVNSIIENGVGILNIIIDVIKSSQARDSLEMYIEVYNKIKEECSYSVYGAEWESKYTPEIIIQLIDGVIAMFDVNETLKVVGKSFATFPCSELRQETWDRFCNYRELTEYFKVHEMMDYPSSLSEYIKTLGRQVTIKTIKDISKTLKSDHNFLSEIMNKKIEARSEIEIINGDKKSPMSEKERESVGLLHTLEIYNSKSSKEDLLLNNRVINIIYKFALSICNLSVLSTNVDSRILNFDILFENKILSDEDEISIKKQVRILSSILGSLRTESNSEKNINKMLSKIVKEYELIIGENKFNTQKLNNLAIKNINEVHTFFKVIDKNETIYQDLSFNVGRNLFDNCINYQIFRFLYSCKQDLIKSLESERGQIDKDIKNNKIIKSVLDMMIPILTKEKYKLFLQTNSMEAIVSNKIIEMLENYEMDTNEYLKYFLNDKFKVWERNRLIYKDIMEIIQKVKECLENSNMSYMKKVLESKGVSSTFKEVIREIDNIFEEENILRSSDIFNNSRQKINERLKSLSIWTIQAQSSVIGINGKPIVRTLSESNRLNFKTYKDQSIFYSTYGFKIVYPSINKIVDYITNEDIDFIFKQLKRTLGDENN